MDKVLDGATWHVTWALALLALALLAFAFLALAAVVVWELLLEVTVVHVSLNLGRHNDWLFLGWEWLLLGDGLFDKDNWLRLGKLLNNGLLDLWWLVAWQLDEELDLAVGGEGSGVGHLQLVVIGDLDLVVVGVTVVDA